MSTHAFSFQSMPSPNSQAMLPVAWQELEAFAAAPVAGLPDSISKVVLVALSMVGLAAMLADLQEIDDAESSEVVQEAATCETFYIGAAATEILEGPVDAEEAASVEDEPEECGQGMPLRPTKDDAPTSNVEVFYIGDDEEYEHDENDEACSDPSRRCWMPHAVYAVSALLALIITMVVSMCMVSSGTGLDPERTVTSLAMQEIEALAVAARSGLSKRDPPEEVAKMCLTAFALMGLVAMLVDAQEISEDAEEVQKVDTEGEGEISTNVSLQFPRPCIVRHMAALGALLVPVAILIAALPALTAPSVPVPAMSMSLEAVQELEALGRVASSLPDEMVKLALVAGVMVGIVAMYVDAAELSESADELPKPTHDSPAF
eukprot:gnl/TRDRNA2_/TRDRNA2_154585_c0_seq3.p1 gnl/TRDRNA2_/TRDRNA2_154585_c0~~gnl/TRDRNA2_/TRDRNA2_154585_c0_seq3.p1  ORF type:complete len:403 (-),score=90.46 gnl/TRDRNA2_/TRDRNA2_154585_c0_seq3:16-1143(-)